MPNQRRAGAVKRGLWVEEDLWRRALARAGAEGSTLTAEVTAFLRRYVEPPEEKEVEDLQVGPHLL